MEQQPKLSRVAEYALGFAAAIPALYWAFTSTGPFKWLVAWENATLGWSSDKLTVALLALPLYGVLRVIVLAARASTARVTDETQALDGSEAPPAASGREPHWRSGALAGGALLVLLAAAGAVWFQADRAGPLQKLTAADFAAGRVSAPILFAEVSGVPARQVIRERKGRTSTLYVPLGEGEGKKPIAVVVAYPESEMPAREAGRATAIGVARSGLDGGIRSAFDGTGVAFADQIWVLRPGTPDKDKQVAAALALAALPIAAFIYAMRRRFAKA